MPRRDKTIGRGLTPAPTSSTRAPGGEWLEPLENPGVVERVRVVVGEEAEDGSPCGDELVEKVRPQRFGASASQICVVHVVRMSLVARMPRACGCSLTAIP